MLIQILLGAIILIVDQWTKFLALKYLAVPVVVIPEFFNLTLVMNPGAAFGLLAGWPDGSRQLVLLLITAIAMLVVIHLYRTEARDDRPAQFALSVILAGAVGNLIDRMRFGQVVDFLDFYIGSYHWPAFNVADSAISVGVCFLLVRLTFFVKKSEALSLKNNANADRLMDEAKRSSAAKIE